MAKRKKSAVDKRYNEHMKLIEKRNVLLKELTEEQIMAAVDFIGGDGHTIFHPKVLIDKCGWPAETALSVCETHESDKSSWKGTITGSDGKVLDQCCGWYSLNVMYALASVLGVEYQPCIGRGSQSRAIDMAIRKHFKREEVEA